MNIQIREQILNLLLQNVDQMTRVIEDLQKANAELQKQLSDYQIRDSKDSKSVKVI